MANKYDHHYNSPWCTTCTSLLCIEWQMIWPKVVDKGVCREGGGIFFSSPTAVQLIVPTRSSSHCISGQSSSRDFMIGKKLEKKGSRLGGFSMLHYCWAQMVSALAIVSKQHLQNSQANKKERQLAAAQQLLTFFRDFCIFPFPTFHSLFSSTTEEEKAFVLLIG